MEIGAIQNNYSDFFQDIVSSQAKEIQKTVILEQLNSKILMASITADSILASFDGYEMDSAIPENSTVSFHV